jgi:hypothetical protein
MKRELFTAGQVARVLSVDLWRVKNFSQGNAFGLTPTLQVGTGRGSRKLYSFDDVLRLAIAHALTEFGFSPPAVGAALRVVRKSDLMGWSTTLAKAGEAGEEPDEDTMRVLTCIGGKWEVMRAAEVRMQVTEVHPFFALNVSALLVDVVTRITELI